VPTLSSMAGTSLISTAACRSRRCPVAERARGSRNPQVRSEDLFPECNHD
jgi:hypothetical protein